MCEMCVCEMCVYVRCVCVRCVRCKTHRGRRRTVRGAEEVALWVHEGQNLLAGRVPAEVHLRESEECMRSKCMRSRECRERMAT